MDYQAIRSHKIRPKIEKPDPLSVFFSHVTQTGKGCRNGLEKANPRFSVLQEHTQHFSHIKMVRHGGLSRAGKVKNSTPKVCTSDGPKAKSGRSKKRTLYGKRIAAGSDRKGPNHQA